MPDITNRTKENARLNAKKVTEILKAVFYAEKVSMMEVPLDLPGAQSFSEWHFKVGDWKQVFRQGFLDFPEEEFPDKAQAIIFMFLSFKNFDCWCTVNPAIIFKAQKEDPKADIKKLYLSEIKKFQAGFKN